MEAIFLLAIVGLCFYLAKLSGRVSDLEETLRTGQSADLMRKTMPVRSQAPATAIPPAATHKPVTTASWDSPQSGNYALVPAGPNPFIEWLKEDFLVKLGALLLLIALGWFVSFAFANNWIGPAGRITIGLVIGLVFLVVGALRIKSYKHQGSIFAVLGSATVILTLFAARELYGFFTPASSLLLMFLSVVFVAFLSVRFSAPRLAIAGLVLAAVAPMFTAAPQPDVLNLFLYLTVIVLGSIWVVFLTGWSTLTPIALVAVAAYSAPFLGYYSSPAEQDIALFFTFGFTALFFVTNIVSTIRRPFKHHLPAQVLTAVVSILYLAVWIVEAVTPHLQSLVFSVWALVFAVGAYLVFVATKNRVIFYLYGAMSVGLIGAATAAELSGPALTIAFILESGLLLILLAVMRAPVTVIRNASFVLIVPILLSLESLGAREWREGILHSDFVVVSLMTIMLAAVTLKFYEWSNQDADAPARDHAKLLYVAFAFFATAWVWVVAHALLPVAGTTVALVIYTIVGLLAYIFGQNQQIVFVKRTGAVLIGLVVLRLLFIDVWDMPLSGRIITFFIIGVLLISTAFIKKKHHLSE